MSMWKRIASLIAVVAFAISITACGGGEAPQAKKTPAKTKAPEKKAPDAATTQPA
jgi:hypothetical protein